MARPDSDIDPRKLDAAPRRKRRRNDRAKPEPKPTLKAGEDAAVARALARPMPPGVMLEPRAEGWEMVPAHNDRDLFDVMLADCFGTRSTAVMEVFTQDLRRLCPQAWDAGLERWKDSEVDLNTALAMVADWQPENTAQAALAAQMVAVHWLTMRLSEQALNRGGMIMEQDAALAGKLARTYAQLCETMQVLKGKPSGNHQSIKVTRESHHHQHIHVHREGASDENTGQAHEPRASTIEGRAALSCPREVNGAVVPFPGGQGENSLPQARRGKRRGAEGC